MADPQNSDGEKCTQTPATCHFHGRFVIAIWILHLFYRYFLLFLSLKYCNSKFETSQFFLSLTKFIKKTLIFMSSIRFTTKRYSITNLMIFFNTIKVSNFLYDLIKLKIVLLLWKAKITILGTKEVCSNKKKSYMSF